MAAELIARAARASSTDKEVEACLQNATSILDEARSRPGALPANPDFMTLQGFHCLTRHILAQLDQKPIHSSYLQRAENFFEHALKLKKSAPRALMGKACVMATRRDWKKALECFRKVLHRASPPAPRDGEQLKMLKEVRFALATCFAGLGRFDKARKALLSVVAADANDVESLCALAYLESKPDQGSEGKIRSKAYMARAMQADPTHPAVLTRAADHAFNIGMEDYDAGEDHPPAWRLSGQLLQRALQNCNQAVTVAEVNYQWGRMAHVRCQYREARDLYKKCIQTSPDHLAAVYLYTQCLIHERSFSTAVRVIEEAPPQLREEPQVMKLLATGYLATGEHDHQAKAACDRLVIRTPEDFEAWAMRAEVYSRFEKVGYPKETFESYEAMFDLVKDSAAACARVTPQMWNNWGTMLAVYGDPGLAQEAYVRGINSLEEKQRLGDAVGQAAKDLDAAHITLKFNRAWLAASTGGDMLEAIHVYIGLAERCKWFADAFLQLGLEWQRVGKTDEAMRNFQEAMKHSPFMGKLLCSEALRESGKYPEALKWGDRAARHARHDQIHYACVFAGNLYFEASNHYKTKSSSKDGYLRKAMKYFVKALAAKKDCQFAANGIGMVFAERGKFELAKQAFQSVVNHQGMEDNPSVHINLAHSYVQANTSENDIRKAIDLYRAAKNLDPEDKNVRAYIAKAHFMLQEYEDCRDVLAEAIFFKGPDDIPLLWNQIICWEAWARQVLGQQVVERKMTYEDLIQKVKDVLGSLLTAVRTCRFIQLEWERMSDSERRRVAHSIRKSEILLKDLDDLDSHITYCEHLTRLGTLKLDDLSVKHQTMQHQIKAIEKQKAEAAKEEEGKKKQSNERDKEKCLENEDQAQRLMDSTKTIELGKNLETQKDPKVQRPSKKKRTEEAGLPSLPAPGSKKDAPDEEAKPIADSDIVQGGDDLNDMADIFQDDEDLEYPDQADEKQDSRDAEDKSDKTLRKEKKEKKDKKKKDKKEKNKDKKEHKKEKKDKKRKRDAGLDADLFD